MDSVRYDAIHRGASLPTTAKDGRTGWAPTSARPARRARSAHGWVWCREGAPRGDLVHPCSGRGHKRALWVAARTLRSAVLLPTLVAASVATRRVGGCAQHAVEPAPSFSSLFVSYSSTCLSGHFDECLIFSVETLAKSGRGRPALFLPVGIVRRRLDVSPSYSHNEEPGHVQGGAILRICPSRLRRSLDGQRMHKAPAAKRRRAAGGVRHGGRGG